MDEEEALGIIRSAFAPFHAGASISELRSIVFRVVDDDGNGVMALNVIPEEVWAERDELIQLLTGLREMLTVHGERALTLWHP
jgi:hypothetical protein